MTAIELFRKCNGIIGSEYPEGMEALPEIGPVGGRGFFPVASGSFLNSSTLDVRGTLLFVGQDWGCVENLAALKDDRDADIKEGTGKKLKDLVEEACIPLEECFFTNALFGVRNGTTNTCRSPGWLDPDFVARCERALILQVTQIRPKAIISLGRDAPDLLVSIVRGCERWQKAATFGEIDETRDALITLTQPTCGLIAAAILVHPSFRHANVKHRKFKQYEGHQAEVAMLIELWDIVSAF